MSVPLPLYIKEPLAVFLLGSRNLPIRVAFTRATTVFAEDIHLNPKVKKRIYQRHQQAVRAYLEKKYKSFWNIEHEFSEGERMSESPIWFFWWQGVENAPEVVKLCYQQLKRMAQSHPVIVVDEENYSEYVTFPEHILEKQKRGQITLTHFSDILRANLLARYGGFWMDATIYCSEVIPEEVFTCPVFTGKNPEGDWTNVSHWNWTGYMLSTWKNNTLPVLMSKFFDEYWKQENRLIDYYLIDYVIALICNYYPAVKKTLDDIPSNNTRQHELLSMLPTAYVKEAYEELLYHSDTTFHKLSWKEQFMDIDADGRQTTFDFWMRQGNTL